MPEGPAAYPVRSRPLLVDVLRSELAKLFTVRSTYWTLLSAFVATVLVAVVLCEAYVHRYSHLNLTQLSFNPTSYSLSGVLLAQLAVAVLGVLVISGEHASGMIRATFTAVPQRGTVLAAKAGVLTGVVLLATELSSFAGFFVGQAILSSRHASARLSDPGVLRAVIGAGLYLAVLGLLALALGTIIRHSAGAIAVLFGLLLVLPAIAEGLPHPWQDAIDGYLPSNAGQTIFHTANDTHLLAPWTGFAIFCLYTSVAVAVAAVAIRRRDV